ncbi:MAG: S-formylglutathione hydrolase [Xanthomonadaceae bacterium]|nr:S-formylglutathione hydrolase [Xanthomonadaceae bacterium]
MMMCQRIASHRCFGGTQGFYRHRSSACNGQMNFAVFVPPQAERVRVPVLYWLSGLSCTEQNFTLKAGAQRVAAELGLMLVVPDTSPRTTGIPNEAAEEHLGAGASLYVDATREPWSRHFQMYTYIVEELPALIAAQFPADVKRSGIFGHSMGGHGALTIALRNPERYRSVSALAPIAAPTRVGWCQRAFSEYLGTDRETWNPYDACELLASGHRFPGEILVDQGAADPHVSNLHPELLEAACARAGQTLNLRGQAGYDHSYFFVVSYIADHLRHHARAPA